MSVVPRFQPAPSEAVDGTSATGQRPENRSVQSRDSRPRVFRRVDDRGTIGFGSDRPIANSEKITGNSWRVRGQDRARTGMRGLRAQIG